MMSNSFSFLLIHNYRIISHNIDLSRSPGSVAGSAALVPPYKFMNYHDFKSRPSISQGMRELNKNKMRHNILSVHHLYSDLK